MMEPEGKKPKKKLAELTQGAFFLRSQTLVLYEDRLEVTVRAPLERYRFPFYLHALKDDPDLVLLIRWREIFLASTLLLVGLALFFFGPRPLDPVAGGALAFLGLAGLSFALLRARKVHVYLYRPAPGEGSQVRFEPQLWIYPAQPSGEEVRRFEELLKITRERQMERGRMDEEGIPYARELERFGTLKKHSLVTEEEFALVKAKLLNLRQRRIGF